MDLARFTVVLCESTQSSKLIGFVPRMTTKNLTKGSSVGLFESEPFVGVEHFFSVACILREKAKGASMERLRP